MIGMAEGLFLFLAFNSSPTTRVAFASKILREGQITRQRPKISFKKNKAISDSLVHPKKVTAGNPREWRRREPCRGFLGVFFPRRASNLKAPKRYSQQ